MLGFFSLTINQLGALRTRVVVQVETMHEKTRKHIDGMITDTSVVHLTPIRKTLARKDTAELYRVGIEQPLRVFSLPDEVQEILEYIDSVDAVESAIAVDTTEHDKQHPLRTRIVFNESARVNTLSDGAAVSVALYDRALVITEDTVRVLPQYLQGLPDTLKRELVLPKSTTVLNPNRVIYRFSTAENPLDTVINGEEAKLFRSYRHWVSDVVTSSAVVNTIRQVQHDEKAFGFWRTSDTSYTAVPDNGPVNEVPTVFRFNSIDVDIPAAYYPVSPALCDMHGDYAYLCTPSDGWIRLHRNGKILHMPLLSYIPFGYQRTRCVAFRDGVLLTYDKGGEDLQSVYVSPLGVRLSNLIIHARSVILAPVDVNGVMCLEAYWRSDSYLNRKIVWRAVSPFAR